MSRKSKKRASEQMDRLRTHIERAFSTIPYPGDSNLVSEKVDTDVGWFLRGKHWKDIAPGLRRGSHWITKPPELLQGRIDFPLYYLTVEAYIFYLPAYLIACLDYDAYYDVADSTIYSLSPLYKNQNQHLLNCVEAMDAAQLEAVRMVFLYLKKYGTYQTEYLLSAIDFVESIRLSQQDK